MLKILRGMVAAAAAATTGLLVLTIPQSSKEAGAALAVLVVIWTAILWWSWSSPRRMLPVSTLLFMLGAYVAFAESLPYLERSLGFSLSPQLALRKDVAEKVARIRGSKSNSWQQFGSDPLFFRREPGSVVRSRRDRQNTGPEFETVADSTGYVNETSEPDQPADIYISGGSVIEGVGTPSLVAELRSRLGSYRVRALSAGNYSPRQKTRALEQFALSARPRAVVIEFHAGTDASTSLEDEICEANGFDYQCRFDIELMSRSFATSPLAGMGDFGGDDPAMDRIAEIRSTSLTLALTSAIATNLRGFVEWSPMSHRVSRIDGEAVDRPGAVHFRIHDDARLDWNAKGLAVASRHWSRLADSCASAGVQMILLYHPTAYEIYREILSGEIVDAMSDRLSAQQRSYLRQWSDQHQVRFVDLTEAFRERVKRGDRGLFGRNDGTHWTEKGRQIAADVFADAIQRAMPGQASLAQRMLQ